MSLSGIQAPRQGEQVGTKRIKPWRRGRTPPAPGAEPARPGVLADGQHDLDPARFPHVSDDPDEIVIRTAADGSHYTYASPNVRGILGYAPEELLGQRPLETVHPDDLTRAKAVGDRRSAGSDRETVLLRNRHADGHYVWLESRVTPIRDPETDEVLEIEATARDVTASVTTEQALRQRISAEALIAEVSRELLTVTADEVDAVVVRSLERAARFVGAERATLVVLSPDEQWAVRTHQWASEPEFETDEPQASVTGLPWLLEQCRAGKLVFARSLGDLPREASAERAVFEGVGVRSFACRPITREEHVSGGLAFNWRSREAEDCTPALSALLVLGDVLAVALDRQRAEQALASSEARFRSLVQGTSGLIVVADPDGCVTYVSPSVRQFGYSEEDFIGRSPFELVHPDDTGEAAIDAAADLQPGLFLFGRPEPVDAYRRL